MFDENLCLLTDSYKPSHHKQYPPYTEMVYSFFESRGGRWPAAMFFGLQYFLMRYLLRVPTERMVNEAADILAQHFGNPAIFNRGGWLKIARQGFLPIRIRAVPEGTIVPNRNVLMTVENTDPEAYWLTNYIESLLVQVWYPITVATQSREIRKIILAALERTGDPAGLEFKLHDFGFRGSTSVESSAIGGCAHLATGAKGTDTLPALLMARDYYSEPMAGHSIPAAEHSTITAWGETHEAIAFRNMLDQFPTGFVAVVSDSYNIFRACSQYWGRDLRDNVLQRDGVLVVRPDSGDPPEIVCKVLELLGEAFGYTKNAKGYKVLHDKVRVIQGDGIDILMAEAVLTAMIGKQWSADNIAFGSGGGLLQKVDRDTLKFAFKCSATKRAGIWHDVIKTPITDSGKNSKAGRFELLKTETGFVTRRMGSGADYLHDVFVDGRMVDVTTLADVRERAAIEMPMKVTT